MVPSVASLIAAANRVMFERSVARLLFRIGKLSAMVDNRWRLCLGLVDIYNQGANKTTWQWNKIFFLEQIRSEKHSFFVTRNVVEKRRTISHVKGN